MELVVWASAVLAAYVVLAGVGVAFGLGFLLTQGRVDWSGERRPAPTDPVVIGYRGDPKAAFGWDFLTITYATELGPAEAWLIPAAAPARLWAIWVHGIGGTRENGYRIAEILHDAGVTTLMITYRNDRGAPRAPDGLYSFGLTEWRDLEAAVEWAIGQGAERIAIVAESMGAAIAGQYLHRGRNIEHIAGLALDAPALDFPAIVRFNGSRYWAPLAGTVTAVALWLSKHLRRDLREAGSLDAVAAFERPLFIAHGRRDPLVPFSISADLAAQRPDAIFHAPGAKGHPLAYAHDPQGYERRLLEWLKRVQS